MKKRIVAVLLSAAMIFTMAPDDFEALRREYPYVTAIGQVWPGKGQVYVRHEGKTSVLQPTGWNHFHR